MGSKQGEGGGEGEGEGVEGGGGRGHSIHLAIYCTTTWCFALKGLRTTTCVRGEATCDASGSTAAHEQNTGARKLARAKHVLF